MATQFPLSIRLQRYWLFLFLILIPFSTWYLVQTPFAISPINLFSVVFVGFGLYHLIRRLIPYSPVIDRGTVLVLAGLFLAITYGLFFSDPLRSGIGFWVSRLTQPMLVGFFVYQMVAAEKLKIEEVVAALFWSMLPLVVGGVLQLLHIIPFINPGRVSVAYHWPDTFGRYMEILLLISFPWIITFKRQNFSYWLLWILGIVIMLASLSYNVAASFSLGMIVILSLFPAEDKKLARLGISVIVALLLLAFLLGPHLPKWQSTLTSSRETRYEFWVVAVAVIKQHFWTGIGLKGWQLGYTHFVELYGPYHPPINYGSEQPQNIFLDSFLKAGLPGFLAVTAILIWPIWRGWQIVKSNTREWNWFALSMVGYGVGMLAFGLLDDPLWSDDTTPLLFIFLLLLGLIFAKFQKNGQR